MVSTPAARNAPPTIRESQRRCAQLPRLFRWFSEHCVLRPIDTSDAARIWHAVLNPAFERCWSLPAPRSEAELAGRLAQAQVDWQRGTRYAMAVLRKRSHDFVGCVEARAGGIRGAWTLDWFFHPDFVAEPLAREALEAAAELLFGALDAHTLHANCPRDHWLFEHLLEQVGFHRLVPAGSVDPATSRPRPQALFELARPAWQTAHGRPEGSASASGFASTTPKLELALL